MYIYVSNEDAADVNVHFDDLKITHTKSKIVQMDDYYPFGSQFNSFKREDSKVNDFLYNGKEMQDELDVNWMDYGARMYDPAIGRWYVVDPLSEEYWSWSPYNYTMNNPVYYIDPNGEFVGTLIGAFVGAVAGGVKAAVKGENVMAGIGEGAVAGAIAGAVVDITIATGGSGLVLIGAAAAGGGLGAAAGDIVGQGIEGFTDKNQSIGEAVSLDNKDYSNTLDKAVMGAAFGAVGGAAGVAVGKVAQAAKASTTAVQSTMSKNITSTANTLNKMGASSGTTQKAVTKITEGMGAAGRNTANNVAKSQAAATVATESTINAVGGGYQLEHKIKTPTGILGGNN